MDPSKPLLLQSENEFSKSPTSGTKEENDCTSPRSMQRSSSYQSLTPSEKLKYGPNCPENIYGYKEMSKCLGGARATVQVMTLTMGTNPTPTVTLRMILNFHISSYY